MKRKEKKKKKWKDTSKEEEFRTPRKKLKSSKPKYRHTKIWLEDNDEFETQTSN